MTQRIERIPTTHLDGKYLGRHIEHDERSKDFPAEKAEAVATVLHKRVVPIFDQGQLGSCTGNAAAGLLGTAPFTVGDAFSEKNAVAIYEQGTVDDGYPGTYPPDDTGSSGLGVAKACKGFGYIKSYRHAFGLQHALLALTLRPVIIGINWYDSFDNPGASGQIAISPNASVRGGHEVELLGIDNTNMTVLGANSWSDSWGDRGYFIMSYDTFDRLLGEGGDVTTMHS